MTRELFAAGARTKSFDKIVKDLEGFVQVVEKAGMVVDRFFTTPNYSEAECRKVADLLLTSKEPLASFASIKDAEVKDVIVDNEANVATWLAARKAVAALQLSEPVTAAITKLAAEGNLLRVKLVARKAAEVRATTAKSVDVVVSSAVALSKAQQEAVAKTLPKYVTAGEGEEGAAASGLRSLSAAERCRALAKAAELLMGGGGGGGGGGVAAAGPGGSPPGRMGPAPRQAENLLRDLNKLARGIVARDALAEWGVLD